MRDKSKYVMIADKLRNQIYSGELVSGEKFYARKQLCEMFGISLMTAFNVQKVLQDAGLIACVPGVGFFVNRPELFRASHPHAPVHRIRLIGSPQAIGEGTDFGSELVAGIRESCEKHALQLNIELVQVLNNPAHIINTSRHLEDDEALLLFLHDELLPEVVNLLLSPDVRAVTIGRTFPDRPAVLHDYRHLAEEIFSFCHRRNVKKLLYAGQCSSWTILCHESELFEAFRMLAEKEPFEYRTNFSGNFPEIVNDINRYRPDAVFFSHDEAALRVRDHYFADGDHCPLFIGFGDLPSDKGMPKLAFTYRADAAEMGHRAVEILLRPDLSIHPPLYERVKGRFIERN